MNIQSKMKIIAFSFMVCTLIFTACSFQSDEGKSTLTASDKISTMAAGSDLSMAISFFDFNYCGSGQTVSWRGNCHMGDAVTGGYHDAGDHVKFGLPLAFSITFLCWADYEYGISADAQIRRGIDFIKKCWNGTSFVYQVGDGGADHGYWGAPELQTGARPIYSTSQGSAVMAGSATALALAYITGHGGDLAMAKSLYAAAESAKSDAGYTAANGFYTSFSGFYDELILGAVWLYIATGDTNYLNKAESYFGNLNTDYKWTYAWDDCRYAGILKLAQLTGKKVYINWIENHFDYWNNGDSTGSKIKYTPGGLPFLDIWGVLRYASAEGFMQKVWADYTSLGTASKKTTYKNFLTKVVNYIEGNNPRNSSYIVGFGNNWPKCPHHRAASPAKNCPSLHELTGALVGGPDANDAYNDDTMNYQQTEVAIDYNASLVAALAAVNGTLKSPVYPLPQPPVQDPAGNGTGLTGAYFNNMALTAPAVLTKVDANLNLNWAGGAPTGVNVDGFSTRWTGQLLPRMTDTFTFYLRSDDGSRLYINNTLVVDNWSDHAADAQYEKSGSIALTRGQKVDIRVEYYENAGDAAIYLSWASPWLDKEIIPTTQLFPSATGSSSSSVSSAAVSSSVSSRSVISSSSRSSVASVSSTPVSSSRSSVASISSAAVSSAVSSTVSSSGSNSSVGQYIEKTAPFVYDGAGEFFWKMSNIPSFINCWNLTVLDINGVSFLNKWASPSQLPAKQGGYYYIHYKGQYPWSHFEAK